MDRKRRSNYPDYPALLDWAGTLISLRHFLLRISSSGRVRGVLVRINGCAACEPLISGSTCDFEKIVGVYSTVVVHPRDEEDENFSDPEAYSGF